MAGTYMQPFRLGGLELPFVATYRYLGVVFASNGRWSHHISYMLDRGKQRFATCVAWAQREKLNLAWTARLFQVYVMDAFLYGAEFIFTDAVALRSLDRHLRTFGRRLLGWPAGAPIAAVFGELGWCDAEASALRRTASLWARLESHACDSTSPSIAGRVFRYARWNRHSWAASVTTSLAAAGIPNAASHGVGPGQPTRLARGWVRQAVVPGLRDASFRRFRERAADIASLSSYLSLQPLPELLVNVHNRRVPASDAREWGLARCGHHVFADGRISRHSSGLSCCMLCGEPDGSLHHAQAFCPATTEMRRVWAARSGLSAGSHPDVLMRNLLTADDSMPLHVVAANVSFVAQVCRLGSLARV